MAYVEFDGKLDGEESTATAEGFLPFDGELDPPTRTWGEAASDTAVQLGEGVNTIIGAVPNLVAPESGAAKFFNENAEYWRGQQSDALKSKIATADQAITAAGEDGIISQITEAARQYFSDPALAARFVTTNLPSMIPGIGAAKVAQAAALAKGATAIKAAGVATTAAGATNAVLNAGGARGEAFEDIKSTLIQQGMTPDEAEEQALKDSRVVAAIGGLTGYFSGKTGLEKALVGGSAKSGLRAGVGSAVTELAGEQLEEVAPKLATNVQASQYDNRSIGQDVGRTIVETAIASGPGSVVSGVATASKPTVDDIAAASTVDEAIAAATAVVEAPVDVTPADSLIEAVNPYDVGGFVTRAQAGEETDVDSPQRGLFGGGGEVAAPELAQAAEADRQAESQAEFDEFLRKEQIDATYMRQAAIEAAQKARAFDLAEQQRREADIPAMQQQVANQRVEQAEAITSAQGFDTTEPTTMQLAMQRAQERRKLAMTPVSQRAQVQPEGVQLQQTDTQELINGREVNASRNVRLDQGAGGGATADSQRTLDGSLPQAAGRAGLAGIAESGQGAEVTAPSQPIAQPEITQPAPAAQAGSPKTPVAVEQSGKSNFVSAKSDAGLVGGHVRDGALYISTAEVKEEVRGKGEGVKLYSALVDDALSKGLRVYSDSTVEADAAHVYEALRRRGYDVRRLAGGRLEDGSVFGRGAKEPAFEIISGPNSRTERRSDFARRRAVAEMSPDEMRQALLTSEKTGIPNLRAFEERVHANPQDKVLYGDLDDFKAMNTKLGHDGADQVLRAVGAVKAQIAERMGVNPYHRSGDEFLATGLDDATLNAYGKAVQDELAKATFQITMPDGRVVTQNGVGFSYGTGQNTEFAETRANEQKAERKRLGLRAGQRDVVEAPERGGQDNEDNAVGRDGTPAQPEQVTSPEEEAKGRRAERLREVTTPVSKRDNQEEEVAPTAKAEEEAKRGDDDKDPFTGTALLHSGLSPIEAAKNIGKKLDEATKTKIPDWLKDLPKETQDAAKKAGIYVEKKPLSTRLKELRNDAVKRTQQGLFDQFAPLMQLGEREYVLARLSKSSDAPLESLLMYGKPFLNDAGAVDVKTEKGGLIAVLQQLQGEHDRFFAWIAGNRAAKLKAQGRENLFTDSDISALKSLNQGQMADGKSRAMLYEGVRIQFNTYSKSVLDIAEKAGIINGEDRSVWESDFYVPFYRVMEDEGFKGPKNVSGLVNQYAFKKLKGGTDDLNDLMQNTLRNWSHLLSASLKNQAAATAITTAEKAGIATKVSAKQKGAVTILEDGKEKHYVVDDPFIMDAITSLEWAGWNNPAMKAMTKAKHYLTLGVTISPTFKIRNLMRDQMAAVGLNPISYNIMNNLADGWKGTNKESEQYAKMLTGGGLMRFGTFLEDDRAENMKRLINSGVEASTILDSKPRVTAMLKGAWDWWKEVGDRSENITRAAIYKQRYEQSIKDGMTDDEAHLMASFAARDSMDFSLQGQWGSIRFLTQLVPFMNARLQGLYKLGRDGIMPSGRMLAPQIFGDQQEGDKAKAMRFGAVTGAVALASIALMLAYRDDDDWKNREEWDRDTYWWFKIGDTAYRIPKPFEIGAIGTIAERGLETALNGMDKESRKLFIERMSAMITQTFSMNPIPQLVKPAVDLYANTDSFTGRPIETQGMERLSKAERIGQNTSATAQALGKATSAVGLSPVQIDFLVNAYFSWLGTHAVMTVDFAVRPMMGLPDKPSRRWPDDYFVIGDFAKDLPANQSKYITKFYEQSKEVQQAMADIRYYQSLGNTVKARELMDENKDKVRLYQMYTHAGKQLGDINKRIKIVQARKMDADAKRDEIDRLTQSKIRLTKLIEERRLSRQKEMQAAE